MEKRNTKHRKTGRIGQKERNNESNERQDEENNEGQKKPK